MSIQFDSTEIQNATYLPRFVKHEDNPDRDITSLPLAREEGEVLISELYGKKYVRLQGALIGTTQVDLESKIDIFKELFSRKEKNLDISWNSTTRRYVASCTKLTFDRDHYNTSMVPWEAEFVILSGEGKETSTTTALSAHTVTTTTPGTDTFTISGSKPAKPYIKIKGSNFFGNCRGVEYKNVDTGEKITYTHTGSFSTTDEVYFDCLNKKVFFANSGGALTEKSFYGVFPHFLVGTNTVQISCGDLINQSSNETALFNGGASILATTSREAQSFTVPYTDGSFRSVTVAVNKTGTTMGAITWEIQTDTNGSPSGSLVDGNATGTIPYASVTGASTYITSNATAAFSLTANTKYWLILKAAATLDGSNYYNWEVQSNIYPSGTSKRSTDSGATYAADLLGSNFVFRINYGGNASTQSVAHTVTYTKTYL